MIIKDGVFGSKDQSVYRCAACGHLFLWPLPDDGEEEAFYTNEYPAYLLLRGDSKSASPEEHFTRNMDEARRRFETVKSLISPEKSVLEVGSATGFFLDHLGKRVKEVIGIEPYNAYREYANARGIPTVSTLNEVGDRRFDLIFLYYVLEHVRDPYRFLGAIKPLLRDNSSALVIEVPNANEALVSLYRSPAYDRFVWQRAHCSYFSVDVLKGVIARLHLSAEFIPVQRYDISNHLYWLTERKPGGTGKYAHIFSEALNQEYKEDLKRAWLCDTILAIGSPQQAP